MVINLPRPPREWIPVKKIAILPTLLTLGNGVCGFASIAYASKIGPHSTEAELNTLFVLSACLILTAMVFDALDGYAARLSKTASDFGGQLDSLCDAVSFGAAPAFLLLRLCQDWRDQPLVAKAVAVIAALYMVCALLRLARFNIENAPDPSSHKRFKGLPSPAAAGCLAALAILRSELPLTYPHLPEEVVRTFVKMWAPPGALIVALLMVSRLPYPHFTNQLLRGKRSFGFLVEVVFVLFGIALVPDIACFLLFWMYALNGPVRYALLRAVRRGPLPSHRPGLD
jgi:CDP-diacylglycerol--serine O-phosphatidyltransferase